MNCNPATDVSCASVVMVGLPLGIMRGKYSDGQGQISGSFGNPLAPRLPDVAQQENHLNHRARLFLPGISKISVCIIRICAQFFNHGGIVINGCRIIIFLRLHILVAVIFDLF